VSSALKLGSKESINDFMHRISLLPRRQTEDIGIIVLTSPASTKGIMTQGSPYPFDLISGNAHTNASVAYQDTKFKITPGYRSSYLLGNIRVVYRVSSIAAKILIAMPSLSSQLDNKLLEI
jgi:hypothetical protein